MTKNCLVTKLKGSVDNDNLPNLYTYGVINLNKYEGTKGSAYAKPWFLSQQTDNAPYGEALDKFGIVVKSGVSNPTEQEYIHALTWTSAKHTTANTDQVAVDVKMASYGFPIPVNCSYLKIGFWLNKTQYATVSDSVSTGIDVAISTTTGTYPASDTINIMVPGEYTRSIKDAIVSAGMTSQKVKVEHLDEKTVNGVDWVYICLTFEIEYLIGSNIQPFTFFKVYGFSKYLVDNSLSELELQISGVTVTTTTNPLIPSFNYPWEDYVPA